MRLRLHFISIESAVESCQCMVGAAKKMAKVKLHREKHKRRIRSEFKMSICVAHTICLCFSRFRRDNKAHNLLKMHPQDLKSTESDRNGNEQANVADTKSEFRAAMLREKQNTG